MQSMQLITRAANIITAARRDAGGDGSRSTQAPASVAGESLFRKKKNSDPACVWRGSDRVDCHECHGRVEGHFWNDALFKRGKKEFCLSLDSLPNYLDSIHGSISQESCVILQEGQITSNRPCFP